MRTLFKLFSALLNGGSGVVLRLELFPLQCTFFEVFIPGVVIGHLSMCINFVQAGAVVKALFFAFLV